MIEIKLIALIKGIGMKRIVNSLFSVFFVMSFSVIMPLKGMDVENKPVIEIVTSEDVAVLKDIVKQAAKIMRGRNASFARERIEDLMAKLDSAIQEKIADDIKIIIEIGDPYQVVYPKSMVTAAPERMKESAAAYRNLGNVVKAIEAQAHLIEVAKEAKSLIENASSEEKSGIINVALQKIQSATQVAKKAVDRLYLRAANMLKLSEDNVFERINLLREIVSEASLYKDEKMRDSGKKRLIRLMRSNLLNVTIRDMITPDIKILLDTTDETLEISQKAYERLRDMVEGADKEGKSIIAMLKEGKELVQKAPLSNFQKVSEFVTNQILNVSNLLEDVAEQDTRSLEIMTRRASGGYGLLDILTYPTTERKFILMSDICSLCEQICSEDTKILGGSHMSPQEVMAYRTDKKEELEKLMKDQLLDAETKKVIETDVYIVLDTTDDKTRQEAKAACERLRAYAEAYKPYFRKATAMVGNIVGSGWSKMKDLTESVKTFVYNHSTISSIITGVLVGTAIAHFRLLINNYQSFKEDSMYYNQLFHKTGAAFVENPLGTYQILKDTLQSLGLTIVEQYENDAETRIGILVKQGNKFK